MDGNRPYTDTGFDMYNDIKLRTNGEIYLGVVGPVRTGKSTFIRRFMEMCVLPVMQDENEKTAEPSIQRNPPFVKQNGGFFEIYG